MHQFKELKVWQKGRNLVKEIYKASQKFPKEEQFGISSQIRRSAVSIPSNIAEGCGRNTNNELKRFLDLANGSAFELETLIILCSDLKYFTKKEFEKFDNSILEIQRMIFGFKQTLN